MSNIKQIGLFAIFLVLVGAGCNSTSVITDHHDTAQTLVLAEDYTVVYPETYTVSKVDGVDRLSDGECLVFFRNESNPIVGPGWDKQASTEQIGGLNYNLIQYRENGHQLRVDAHLLETTIHLSLDNPSGFVRCVNEFEALLAAIK